MLKVQGRVVKRRKLAHDKNKLWSLIHKQLSLYEETVVDNDCPPIMDKQWRELAVLEGTMKNPECHFV